MAFNLNNFAIDRILRGDMTAKSDGSFMWAINQITEPQLSITTESADVVDALGSKIVTFNRGKTAEFTANNSIFDLSLFAAQQGNEKEVASSESKIVVPARETFACPSATKEVVLKHTPLEKPAFIFKLNGDDTMGEKLEYASVGASDKFTYDDSEHKITLPTDAVAGTQYLVMYDYESENAVQVVGDAIHFPKAGVFTMEILGVDICNPDVLYHAFLVFPNAKLKADVDISFTTDGNHPFTIEANQDYCDSKKILFKLIVPEDEE